MGKKTVNMLSGSVTKGLLSMAIPIMIMNVTQSLFNMIDMVMLRGKDSAVGAVGACSSLLTVCTCLLIGISAGANVVVARRCGAGERQRASEAATTSMIIAVVGGLVLMFIGILFAETFLKWTNCPEELLKPATTYFRLYFIGIPPLMIYNFSASILRSIGDTKRPMRFLITGGAIKVLFTFIFVNFFGLGVEGVGFATIICNIVICLLIVYTLLNKQDSIHINLTKLTFSIKEFKDILHIGIPSGVQRACYSFANVVILAAVNSLGAEATTGNSIANQFDNILYQVVCAPELAVAPYVAQNMGAKNLKRVKEVCAKATLITAAFGLGVGMLLVVFSRELAGLMTTSPTVIGYAQQKMLLVCSTYFICGIEHVFGGALRGMGRPIIHTVSTFVFMCLLRFFWVYAIFPLCPNLTVLFAVWPVGWVLAITVMLIAFIIVLSKTKKAFANKVPETQAN